jgi:hypothetical protein
MYLLTRTFIQIFNFFLISEMGGLQPLWMSCLGLNPGGGGFSMPAQTGPKAHPATCTMRNESFFWDEAAGGVVLATHPHVRRLWMCRAIPIWVSSLTTETVSSETTALNSLITQKKAVLERSSLSHVTLHTLGEWELGRKKCKTSTVTTLLL